MFKDAGGWIRGPWPFRPRPGEDETLGSYLTRAAHGMGVAPVRLVSMVWGSRRPLLYQDLDNYAPAHVAMRIADGTSLDEDAVAAMTFAAYEGRFLQSHLPKARKTWILPISIESNARHRAGLQICPACLAEDVPYLRRTWRLAFATVCVKHAVELRDRCPRCSAIVHPFRSISLRHCFACGGDLAARPWEQAGAATIKTQSAFEDALATGWGHFDGKPVHSIPFFMLMRRMATLVAIGPRSEALRETLSMRYGGGAASFERDNPRHPVEYLEIADRRRMHDLARSLVTDWPQRLVAICREAGLTRSVVMKDMPYVPFILDEVLKEHLDDDPYRASDAEVAAAAAWLRRTRGLATYRELKAHCGESRASIYRHMDYKRVQATPSVWLSRAAGEAGSGRAKECAVPGGRQPWGDGRTPNRGQRGDPKKLRTEIAEGRHGDRDPTHR